MRHTVLVAGMLSLGLLKPSLLDRTPSVPSRLSLDERIHAQEEISKVYHRHQLGETRSFHEAYPRLLVEKTVRDSLAQSLVLEKLYGVRLTRGLLLAEAARISRFTKLPERLAELHAALGNDPTLILETLVRPALVSRLLQEKLSRNPAVQRGARVRAEDLAARLRAGRLDPVQAHPLRRFVEEAADASTAGSPGAAPALEVEETDAAFVVEASFQEGARHMTAQYIVPKVRWDDWWRGNAQRFDLSAALDVVGGAESFDTLQAPAASCGAADVWVNGTLSQPGPVAGAQMGVWTGNLFLVLAGPTAAARYDPALDAWSPMSLTGYPVGRSPSKVWTGSELILWGGTIFTFVPFPGVQLGGRYNPITDTWTAFGYSSYSRSGHSAVWTGSQMLVWGGQCEPASDAFCQSTPPYTGFPIDYNNGFAYDPVSNTSSFIPSAPIGGRYGHGTVWTGDRMIVWGGYYTFRLGPGPEGFGYSTLGDGGLYDPITSTWTPIPATSLLPDRYVHQTAWTGSRTVLAGGAVSKHVFMNGGIVTIYQLLQSAARFDPVTMLWEALSTIPASAAFVHRSVWTGQEMLLWGGATTGWRFDPASDVWNPISTVNAPAQRDFPAVAWDGRSMLAHGGFGPGTTPLNDGGRYFPAPLSSVDADGDGFSPCGGDCNDSNPAINPAATEVCNGLDDDCDGIRDNDDPGGGAACGVSNVGECRLGTLTCAAGSLVCAGEVDPIPEACNGLDDDCDGSVAGEIDGDLDGFAACAGDCDDANPAVNPAAIDVPGNVADENCDGTAVCSPAAFWKSNGQFNICVHRECKRLVDDGLLTHRQCMILVRSTSKLEVGRERQTVPGDDGGSDKVINP